MWVKVLSAKYLSNANFFDDCPSLQGASWVWRDIQKCKSIIFQGACYKIHKNSNVQTWLEPWIPSVPGFIPSPQHDAVSIASQFPYVRSLFNQDEDDWNLEIIHSLFPRPTVEAILKIRLSSTSKQKLHFWTPNSSGKFSVKSAYLTSIRPKLQHQNHE
ncbi:hypothetical protein Salat_1674700 [Sesamum alatum]|uniref:Uncharacterized protein n=1 Tax=Sesamum alatum TaxID=300844 RepID=A0AAE1Y6W1_9LAMI|nr:hypothetical protein Salat_1674700 [Sesamum alatum]